LTWSAAAELVADRLLAESFSTDQVNEDRGVDVDVQVNVKVRHWQMPYSTGGVPIVKIGLKLMHVAAPQFDAAFWQMRRHLNAVSDVVVEHR
jgi:hypothetical protein